MRAKLLALALAVSPTVVPEPMRAPFARLQALDKSSVANVRAALQAMRDLETSARPLLARGENVHDALARGWERVESLETALQVEGEGEGPERDAVRAMSEARARDAHALRAWEASAPHAATDTEGIAACWQEELLSTAKAETVDTLARLSIENGRVVAVELAPALQGAHAHLGECLQTRLLGSTAPADAGTLLLPVHLVPPKR